MGNFYFLLFLLPLLFLVIIRDELAASTSMLALGYNSTLSKYAYFPSSSPSPSSRRDELAASTSMLALGYDLTLSKNANFPSDGNDLSQGSSGM